MEQPPFPPLSVTAALFIFSWSIATVGVRAASHCDDDDDDDDEADGGRGIIGGSCVLIGLIVVDVNGICGLLSDGPMLTFEIFTGAAPGSAACIEGRPVATSLPVTEVGAVDPCVSATAAVDNTLPVFDDADDDEDDESMSVATITTTYSIVVRMDDGMME